MKSKMKYTFLSMLLAVFAAQPVLASPLNNDDMAFAFGDSFAVSSDMGEMALLSEQEMKETEGEWWPVVYRIGGGLAGMYGAGYGYLAGGGRDPYGFLGSAAAGFGGGLWSPVTGYRSAFTAFGGGFTGGAIGGYGSSSGWW